MSIRGLTGAQKMWRLNAIAKTHRLSEMQKKQVEMVCEVMPDWSDEEIVRFCEKCNFSRDIISQGLHHAFEDRMLSHDQSTENWNVITKRSGKKKEAMPSSTERSKESFRRSGSDDRRAGRHSRELRNRSERSSRDEREENPSWDTHKQSQQRRVPRGPLKSSAASTAPAAIDSTFGPGQASAPIASKVTIESVQNPRPGAGLTYASLLRRSLERDAAAAAARAAAPIIPVEFEKASPDEEPAREPSPVRELASLDEPVEGDEMVETIPMIDHAMEEPITTLASERPVQDLFDDSNIVILPDHIRMNQMDSTLIQFGNFSIGSANATSAGAQLHSSPPRPVEHVSNYMVSNQQLLDQQQQLPEDMPVGQSLQSHVEEQQDDDEEHAHSQVVHADYNVYQNTGLIEAEANSHASNQAQPTPPYGTYPSPVPSSGYPMMATGAPLPHASYLPYETAADHQAGPRPGMPTGYFDPYMQQSLRQVQQRQGRPARQMQRGNGQHGKNRRDRSRTQSQQEQGAMIAPNKSAVDKDDKAARGGKRHHQSGSMTRTGYQPQLPYGAPSHGPIPASAMAFGPSSAAMYPYGAHYGVHQFYGQSQGYAAPPGFARPAYGYQATPTTSHFPNYNAAAAPVRGSYAPQTGYEEVPQQVVDHYGKAMYGTGNSEQTTEAHADGYPTASAAWDGVTTGNASADSNANETAEAAASCEQHEAQASHDQHRRSVDNYSGASHLPPASYQHYLGGYGQLHQYQVHQQHSYANGQWNQQQASYGNGQWNT